MFCPRCGAEYREGFTRCFDCDVDLVPAPPERTADERKDERLVRLCSFPSAFEAQVALASLEAAGIPATIRSDDEGTLGSGLTFTRGADLPRVRRGCGRGQGRAGPRTLMESTANKRIEQNARGSAAQRQAGRVCSCAVR